MFLISPKFLSTWYNCLEKRLLLVKKEKGLKKKKLLRENNHDDNDDDDGDDNDDDDDVKAFFLTRLRAVQASFHIGLRNAVVVVDAFVSNLPSFDVLWSPC